MTEELKTLKDIEFRDTIAGDCVNIDIDWLNEVNVSLLRAEAIKWVKELENALDEHGEGCFELEGLYLSEANYESSDISAVCEFIIHFFNLTEDDLK